MRGLHTSQAGSSLTVPGSGWRTWAQLAVGHCSSLWQEGRCPPAVHGLHCPVPVSPALPHHGWQPPAGVEPPRPVRATQVVCPWWAVPQQAVVFPAASGAQGAQPPALARLQMPGSQGAQLQVLGLSPLLAPPVGPDGSATLHCLCLACSGPAPALGPGQPGLSRGPPGHQGPACGRGPGQRPPRHVPAAQTPAHQAASLGGWPSPAVGGTGSGKRVVTVRDGDLHVPPHLSYLH